ncbi:thioredoxin family protein [Anaeromyxobacter oryzae]|uniref:Uncharacterized protein n=1 Tax=Anaeromyxobacter oryzae TaxID=2918170 RepID=A0ABM7WWZ1_9BACT|nr:thioredoxin family protein [Anaeromyxobacter oryzae]BDG03996.1 hypothetical protein AMOR_29920 [Anaeromyxobacter oryzae]
MRALAAALLLAFALPVVAATHPAAVQDDYPRALSEARARGVPLLVDVWAPW